DFGDVVAGIVESHNLAELAAGIVDPQERAVGDQKLIDAPADLRVCHRWWRRRRSAASRSACGARRLIRIVSRAQTRVVFPCWRWLEGHRNRNRTRGQDNFSLDRGTDASQVLCQLGWRWPDGQRQLQ